MAAVVTNKDAAHMLEDDGKIDVESTSAPSEHEKLDKHGLALIPQPTDAADDPLNWPHWLKNVVLLQISTMAALGQFNSAVVNPAYVLLGKEFHITTVQASYQTTVAIAMGGVGSLLWIPLANVYGRRPVYLFTTLLFTAAALGAARAASYATLLVARVVHGFAVSAALSLGAGVVADLFFLHQRGRAMGIFTVFLVNGAHLAPIPGGYIAQTIGWRWCFYVAGIANFFMLLVLLVALPETLYFRDVAHKSSDAQPWRHKLRLWSNKTPGKSLRWADVVRPFQMAAYPSVLFPMAFYSVQYAYGSIEFALTAATTFSQIYHFKPGRVGLALGLSLLVGSCLGELASGPIMDLMMRRARKRAVGGTVVPEVRLHAIWSGAVLMPVGLLIYGICLHFRTAIAWPCVGMAISSAGLQVIATVTYTYCADCYKPQTSDVSSLFNIGRQTFGFTLAFYSIPLANRVGYQFSFTIFAIIGLAFFVPIVWLMWYGRGVREHLGKPRFNEGL